MFIATKSRRSDKDCYNNEAENFIPIACHYDANTLLTKNGELVQVIQINGVNSEHISDKLFHLRTIVRNAIKIVANDSNCAFWIHTVRRKTNLDDTTSYKKLLPANIHDMWQRKNFWDDKFVNTLYISIVHEAAIVHMSSVSSLVNSLSSKTIVDFQDQYFRMVSNRLSAVVDKLLVELAKCGATKLAIRFDGEYSFSDPLFLYRRIIHLNEENTVVPIVDLSKSLASHKYAVGSDKIEVIDNQGKKFAAMLSIKEYHEVSAEALDVFLQIPVEMITTEIFYFVNKEEVIPKFNEQYYMSQVSGDEKLSQINGVSDIISAGKDSGHRFCNQQISIAIIGDNLNRLEENVRDASDELAKIGIVHVREDINLEQTFWAQLPGNFSFLRRMNPTILENTAALASLHNFPTGSQYSPWGRAITLLRTEKGTPYFANFHVEDSKINNCIFGDSRTGKTILTNFLVSESTKYDPTILYFSDKNNSQIFIDAIEGEWLEVEKSSINPLLCEDNQYTRSFVKRFFKIICNHYVNPLNDQELEFLDILVNDLFMLEMDRRNLSNLIKTSDFTLPNGDTVRARLVIFAEGGLFHGVFDSDKKIAISAQDIKGINLYNFTAQYFTKQFLPDDPKLHKQFEADLQVNNAIRLGLFYAFSYHFINSSSQPKILVIDGADQVLDTKHFDSVVKLTFTALAQNNGITLSNMNLDVIRLLEPEIYKQWIELIDTSYILPSDIRAGNLGRLLNLSIAEVEKLSTFDLNSRMFLVKQAGQSIAAELSLGGFIGMVKILSADGNTLSVYKQILEQYPGHPDNWINHLYKQLNDAK